LQGFKPQFETNKKIQRAHVTIFVIRLEKIYFFIECIIGLKFMIRHYLIIGLLPISNSSNPPLVIFP